MDDPKCSLSKSTRLECGILCFCAGLIVGNAILLYLVARARGVWPGGHAWSGICAVLATCNVLLLARGEIRVRDLYDARRVSALIRYGMTAMWLLAASAWNAEKLGRLSTSLS